jgi:hypothetical protein
MPRLSPIDLDHVEDQRHAGDNADLGYGPPELRVDASGAAREVANEPAAIDEPGHPHGREESDHNADDGAHAERRLFASLDRCKPSDRNHGGNDGDLKGVPAEPLHAVMLAEVAGTTK